MIKTILTKLSTYRTNESFGAVINGLENGHMYDIRIIATNENVASQPSNAMEVQPYPTPTPAGAPGAPVLLDATAKPSGISFEFEESDEGTKPFNNFVVATPSTGGASITAPCNEVAVMGKYFGEILNLQPVKEYAIQLYSENAYGKSPLSNVLKVVTGAPIPAAEKITSKTGRSWKAGGYIYLYWADAGNFEITANQNTSIDLYIVGGGGGGHGQLMPIGTGGIGGGGSIVQKMGYLVQKDTTYTGTVGAGGIGGDTKNGGDSKFMDIVATGGGTSLGKADGVPCTELTSVPDEFNQCAAFLWNTPLSLTVSGYVQWDKNQTPNGVVYGQGGGGTNGTVGIAKAGTGQAGIVVLRYLEN